MADFWKDIGDGLAAVAPTVAGLAANVFAPGTGPLAAAGVSYLMRALGIDETLPEDEKRAQLQQAIATATPEQVLAMHQADLQFAKDYEQQLTEREKIAAADRDSARRREVELKDRTPAVLAAFVTIGFFGLLLLMAFRDLPAANETALNIMLGTLGAAFGGVIGYYFGSTAGSQQKTAALATAARK